MSVWIEIWIPELTIFNDLDFYFCYHWAALGGPNGGIGSNLEDLGSSLGGPRGAFVGHFGGLGAPLGAFGAQSLPKTAGLSYGPLLWSDF